MATRNLGPYVMSIKWDAHSYARDGAGFLHSGQIQGYYFWKIRHGSRGKILERGSYVTWAIHPRDFYHANDPGVIMGTTAEELGVLDRKNPFVVSGAMNKPVAIDRVIPMILREQHRLLPGRKIYEELLVYADEALLTGDLAKRRRHRYGV